MKRSRIVLAVMGSLVLGAPLMAASLSVAPVGLILSTEQKAGAITLTNQAAAPVSLQIRIFNWSQVDGRDVLAPTTDVVASPPATTIPPGAAYTIRVMRLARTPIAASESYRLLIDEIPKPIDPGTAMRGVTMTMRTSLPVFFEPAKAVGHVVWTLTSDHAGVHLLGRNTGGRHVKLADLAIETPAGRLALGGNLAGYILPGTARRFDMQPAAADARIVAQLVPGATVAVTAKDGLLALRDDVHVATP
jgi:fimbrial chaperone protein